MTTETASLETKVRGLEVALEEQARLISDLQARLDRIGANGGDWMTRHPLMQHPHLYQTAAPTDSAANGTIRVVRAGGLSYLYGRSAGAWASVQIT